MDKEENLKASLKHIAETEEILINFKEATAYPKIINLDLILAPQVV